MPATSSGTSERAARLTTARPRGATNERGGDGVGLALPPRALAALLARSGVVVFSQDAELRYTAVSAPFLDREAAGLIGRSDEDLLPDDVRSRVVTLKREALAQGEAMETEVALPTAGGTRWWQMRVEPFRDGAGAPAGLSGTAVDITARKEDEHRLRLFMRELTHRSKNLLAVILAMARQTAGSADDVDTFIGSFSERLQALSSSHDLLVQESWHGVPISSLVRSQLGHYADRIGEQVEIDGPSVLLTAEATQHIGLALHELATNAAKYGSLSVPEGRVRIGWGLTEPEATPGGEPGEPRFTMQWEEENGPAVVAPSRRGFGQVVIERTVARALDGTVRLTYAPTGVVWALDAPMRRVVEDESGN